MPENAIQRRVGELTDRWLDFTEDPERSVLLWRGDVDELRVADAFVAYQTSDGRDVPDLFIRPNTPFESSETFGSRVAREIVGEYREGREALEEDGIAAEWEPPPLDVSAGPSTLVDCVLSLQVHHADLAAHVVVVLHTSSADRREEWLRWFEALLALEIPPEVRFLVLEHEATPWIGSLVRDLDPGSVRMEDLALDMPGAYRELAARGDAGDPGVVFRVAFVEMAQAIEREDVRAARHAGERALEVAEARDWWGAAVSVHVALAGAVLAADRTDAALASYRNAVRTSRAAVDEGDESGPGLLVRSRLALGGALFGQGRFEEAAESYEETARLEEAEDDALLGVEAWRMASHAYAGAGRPTRAWECGWSGLKAAESLDAELREASTLPYLGLWLLDLCEKGGADETAEIVQERLEDLLGEDWEPSRPEPGDGSPSGAPS